VKSLRLNQARIDSLVEQLYDINKRLVSNEGRLIRLSESYGVSREDFLKQYMGNELDPRWLNRISKLSAKGWKTLVAKEKDRIKEIRSLVHDLAAQTGVEISEFRKIVHRCFPIQTCATNFTGLGMVLLALKSFLPLVGASRLSELSSFKKKPSYSLQKTVLQASMVRLWRTPIVISMRVT
jgi:hypothetical protein